MDARIGASPFQFGATAHDLTRWKMPYYKHSSDGSLESEVKDSFADNLFRHLTFSLQYSPSDKFYIAAGYNHKMRTDMGTYHRNFLSGFSAGFGLRVKDFTPRRELRAASQREARRVCLTSPWTFRSCSGSEHRAIFTLTYKSTLS